MESTAADTEPTGDITPLDERIAEQANYLSNHTPLNIRQAEALIRDALHGEDPQYTVAEDMNIGHPAPSNDLTAAENATDETTASVPYWLFNSPGVIDPATYKGVPAWMCGNERIHVFVNQFPSKTNSYNPRYYVVHHHPETDSNDALPEWAFDVMGDPRIRHVTDRYPFDSASGMYKVLEAVIEFDSARKRESFEEQFGAVCEALRADERGCER